MILALFSGKHNVERREKSSKVYLLGQFAGTSEREHIFDCRTLLLTAKIFKKCK